MDHMYEYDEYSQWIEGKRETKERWMNSILTLYLHVLMESESKRY